MKICGGIEYYAKRKCFDFRDDPDFFFRILGSMPLPDRSSFLYLPRAAPFSVEVGNHS